MKVYTVGMRFSEKKLAADLRDYGNAISKPFREGRVESVEMSVCERTDIDDHEDCPPGLLSTEVKYRGMNIEHDTDWDRRVFECELSFQQSIHRSLREDDLTHLLPEQLMQLYDSVYERVLLDDEVQLEEVHEDISNIELQQKILHLMRDGLITEEVNSINITLTDQEGLVDFQHWHDTIIGSHVIKSDDIIETQQWPRPRELPNGNIVRNIDEMPSREMMSNTSALLIGSSFVEIIRAKELTIGEPVETKERRFEIAREIARRLFDRDLGDPLRTDILS